MALVNFNFFSESMMRSVNVNAIIPVDDQPDGVCSYRDLTPFKTLYLLHGVHGGEYDWLTNTRLRRWAQEHRLAVILPAGENRWYDDNVPGRNLMGQFVGDELVRYTRTLFRLSPEREDTYVAGLSMGGIGSVLTGLRYPETFSRVGSFSGAFMTDPYPADDSGEAFYSKRSYMEEFCGPEELYRGGPNDYNTLAETVGRSGARLPEFYMSIGTEDPFLEVNREFRDHLRDCGFGVTYVETPGAHDWDFWEQEIRSFMNWLPLEQ
ncbi:MAG: acetylesterase [Lachnospiraceae bacterium]|nr:acetylesterase [Lachnospiraceae bacterium]MBQ1414301.1 acetylesterase [Lachnospiraceae bacterium]